MKEYKGWEIVKMISENKIKKGTKIIKHYGSNINCDRILIFTGSTIYDYGNKESEVKCSYLSSNNGYFTIEETPVTFQEVIEKDDILCKVDHEYMDGWLNYKSLQKSKEYLELNKLMELLSEIPANDLKTVLKEGKWYIKEREAEES